MNGPATADRLLHWFRALESAAIAYSGGVDSAVVAQAARMALGSQALAVTAVSPSLSAYERQRAAETARQIGIRHQELATREQDLAEYRRNTGDRCFHCKSTLYQGMREHLDAWGLRCLVNGTNADDFQDVRPGLQAAVDFEVRSPLAELNIGKEGVRELARLWQLDVWDKPASPCLASRIAYGQEVTPERLALIEAAEALLRDAGYHECRVRWHADALARIEIPSDQIVRFLNSKVWSHVAQQMRDLGFRFVTLDLEGLRSGNLNQLLEIDGKLG